MKVRSFRGTAIPNAVAGELYSNSAHDTSTCMLLRTREMNLENIPKLYENKYLRLRIHEAEYSAQVF